MDWLLMIVMFALPIIAQINVTSTYKKYNKISNSRGLTGAEVARRILDANGLHEVKIEHIPGNLTDHYDPRDNTVRLSDTVYGSTSVAALGVAAHECGHVCQHAENYAPIVIRSKIVPAASVCSRLWYFVLLAGILLTYLANRISPVIYIAIIMFAAVVVFQIVTLPTEFNASNRALKTLESDAILDSAEIPAARKVLTAAAMTYVASLVTSLIQLFRLLSMVSRRR
ncbi:MAG: zinc metallopeptidase [Ruminococcus sp.]|nr:zinc metallopeptidase [Ruminococcus sp.]